MATPTASWMTFEQLEALYNDLWLRTPAARATINTVKVQIEKAPNPDKAVVFAMATDKPAAQAKVSQVNIEMKTFAARKKDGVWRFSEDKEDIDFVMSEISGLTVEEYRNRRDGRARRNSGLKG